MRIAGVHSATSIASLPMVAQASAPMRARAGAPSPAEPGIGLTFDAGVDPRVRAGLAEALWFIPAEDRALLREAGVGIHVLDAETLPDDPSSPYDGTITEPVVGATKVANRGGRWSVEGIRVAARPLRGTPAQEVLLHEVGHAVSVLRRQDRSEAAAEEYLSERIGESIVGMDPDGGVRLEAQHKPASVASRPTATHDARAGAAAAAPRSGGSVLGVGAAVALVALALLAL